MARYDKDIADGLVHGTTSLSSLAAGELDDLTIDSSAKIELESSLDDTDAIRLLASAGGIDIDAVGAAGQDITITNTGGSVIITSTEDIVNAITLDSHNIYFTGGDQDNYYGFFSKPLYLATIADPDPTLGKLWHQPLGTLNWAYNLEVGGTITAGGLVAGDGDLQIGSLKHIIAVNQIIRFAHSGDNSVIVELPDVKIPAKAIITRVSAMVYQESTLGDHEVNIQMSATSGTSADSAISSGTELLGAGAEDTISTDSGGEATDISLGDDANDLKDVWMNNAEVLVGTSDMYIYICNAADNGTTNSTRGELSVVVEYYGMD